MKLTTNSHGWIRSACLGLGALGVSAAVLSAPAAGADPADPADPVVPTIVAGDTSAPSADAPVPAPVPVPVPVPVQHLSSPDNPPPGTTTTGTDTGPQGRLSYLRDLLHAMRTQEVSGSDALLLLTQRPLDANTAPPPGMSSTPTGPVGTSAAPPAADAAAPTS
ncbi:hypothetical protein [Mycolicibacterium aichiense]|uniref:Uncharacterized protein n=1 Tax=Mycolicibacterium aichiense TaxID=1799 RepID=A0AAD1MAV0_9MYCO|nr:hypothetical protein [Mycolicibacterium aichiense]BBX06843.1 hypothetical protein MAIC_16460 [Mycolicibacterium aichiense]STZ80659.1 transglycosylase domain-containing protein [Mycolicibacterium aichiense]